MKYLRLFLVSAILIMPFMCSNLMQVNSDTKSLKQVYIYIDKVYVYDTLDNSRPGKTWYELRFVPEYMRLFGEYGDRLQGLIITMKIGMAGAIFIPQGSRLANPQNTTRTIYK